VIIIKYKNEAFTKQAKYDLEWTWK